MTRSTTIQLLGALALVGAACGQTATTGDDDIETAIQTTDIQFQDGSCRERCVAHAREVGHACRADAPADDSENDCRAEAVGALRACAHECLAERPPCAERCGEVLHALADRCKASDHTPEECREFLTRAAHRCAARCAGGDGEGGACFERCRGVGEDAGHACLDAGGTPEDCRARALAAARKCAAEHCQRP